MKYAAFVAILILGIAFFLLMGFYAQAAPLTCAVIGVVFICAAYFIGMLDTKYALKRVLTEALNVTPPTSTQIMQGGKNSHGRKRR